MDLKLYDFAKNTFITVITRVLIFIFSLLTTIVIARVLGPAGKGIYTLAILLPTLITKFTNLGIGPATVYHVGKRNFPEDIVLGNNILLSAILGLLSFLLGIIIVSLFRNVFFAGVKTTYLLWALLLAPLTIFNVNIIHILLGKQLMGRYNMMSFLYSFLLFVFITSSLVLLKQHILGLLIATIITLVCANTILFFQGFTVIRKVSFKLNKLYLKETFGFGIPSSIGNILTFLNYRFDMLLVSAFLNPVAVGLYSVSVGIVEQSWLLSQAAGTVLFPRISSEGSEQVRSELTPIICRNVLLLTTIIALVLFVFCPWLIRTLFTTRFIAAVIPLRILLPGIIALSAWRLLYDDIAGRGKPVLNMYMNMVAVAINIVLNILLIPKFDIAGAAWASTISYTTALLGTTIIYIRITRNKCQKIFLVQMSDVELYKKSIRRLFFKNSLRNITNE